MHLGVERYLAWLTTESIVLRVFALDEFCCNLWLEEKSDSFNNTITMQDQ